MADKRISDLPVKGLPLDATDLLVISEDDGAGGYTSKSITGQDILDATGGGGSNMANADLLATGNRSHDFDNFYLRFFDVKDFSVSSSVAPTLGYASFNVNGYGTSSADVIERVKGGTNVIRESFGDKSQQFYGSTGINTIPNGNGWLMIDSSSAGIAGIVVSGTTVAGVRADIPNASCFVGNGQIGVNVNGSYAGVYAVSSGGKAVYAIGQNYTETYGFGGSSDPSAVLEANSTTQGFLPPRMKTTERDAISSPANGLIIYNTTTGKHQGYNGSWNDLY